MPLCHPSPSVYLQFISYHICHNQAAQMILLLKQGFPNLNSFCLCLEEMVIRPCNFGYLETHCVQPREVSVKHWFIDKFFMNFHVFQCLDIHQSDCDLNIICLKKQSSNRQMCQSYFPCCCILEISHFQTLMRIKIW